MHALPDQLRQEILAAGPLAFARFMERALYDPAGGYYTKPERVIGRSGDFYTSVSVGSVFGELLALRFSIWLDRLAANQPGQRLQIVEAGAHDGRLAADILRWLQRHRTDLLERVDYLILEPWSAHQTTQRRRLEPLPGIVRWHADWDSVPPIEGVIFSNELLDAFPVHRLGWDASRQVWFEWGVDWRDHRFEWIRLGPWTGSKELLPEPDLMAGLAPVLPDGFTLEICPAASDWWTAAAGVLRRGWLLTIDYALDTEDKLAPERSGGTLRAYSSHRLTDDPLEQPGEQDLTAHVDFSALRAAGERRGLRTLPVASQAAFLKDVVAWAERSGAHLDWTPGKLRQLQTLLHPDHLGHAFRVLIQHSPDVNSAMRNQGTGRSPVRIP